MSDINNWAFLFIGLILGFLSNRYYWCVPTANKAFKKINSKMHEVFCCLDFLDFNNLNKIKKLDMEIRNIYCCEFFDEIRARDRIIFWNKIQPKIIDYLDGNIGKILMTFGNLCINHHVESFFRYLTPWGETIYQNDQKFLKSYSDQNIISYYKIAQDIASYETFKLNFKEDIEKIKNMYIELYRLEDELGEKLGFKKPKSNKYF